jgi:hypothetical protein
MIARGPALIFSKESDENLLRRIEDELVESPYQVPIRPSHGSSDTIRRTFSEENFATDPLASSHDSTGTFQSDQPKWPIHYDPVMVIHHRQVISRRSKTKA